MGEERGKETAVAPEPSWEAGWDEHRRAQRLRWLRASAAERLAWLEEAIALAHQTGALPRRDPGRRG